MVKYSLFSLNYSYTNKVKLNRFYKRPSCVKCKSVGVTIDSIEINMLLRGLSRKRPTFGSFAIVDSNGGYYVQYGRQSYRNFVIPLNFNGTELISCKCYDNMPYPRNIEFDSVEKYF